MRIIRNSKYWVAWIGIVAYVLFGLNSSQQMVLCFESDGRITLETGIGGVCGDSFQESASHVQETTEPAFRIQAHCQKCFDLPISLQSTEPSAKIYPSFQGPGDLPLAVSSAPVLIGYLHTVTPSLLPHPPPIRPKIHQVLDTVILVI